MAVEVMTVPLPEFGEEEEGLRGPFSVTCPSLLLGGVSTLSVKTIKKRQQRTIQPDSLGQEARHVRRANRNLT